MSAAKDRSRHAVKVAICEPARLAQTSNNFPDRFLFAGRLQVDDDCLTNHKIRKLHPALHRRAAGPATGAGTRGFWAVRPSRLTLVDAALSTHCLLTKREGNSRSKERSIRS